MNLRDLQHEWDEARKTNPLMQDDAFPGVTAWAVGAALFFMFAAIIAGACAIA